MAARRKAKPTPVKQAPGAKTETPAAEPEAAKAEAKPPAPTKTRPRRKRRVGRAKPKARKPAPRKRRAPRPKPARPRRRRRGRYSNADRAKILAAAEKGGLTALQVQEKFGVKPVTYYSWRKNAKVTRKRGPRRTGRGRPVVQGLASVVRASVQERLRAMLPQIVRAEVSAYLGRVFGKGR